MRVHVETDTPVSEEPVKPGNVYHVRGGRGLRDGHMNIVLAVTEPTDRYNGRMALCLTVTRDGKPVGTTSYGVHYFEDKMPIAFCDGLEDIDLTVRSL